MTISSFPRVVTPITQALTGTLPVRAFGAEGFVGTVQVDGQVARVAALATFEGSVLLVSLVGYDTTVSAALAHLWQGKSLTFTPRPGVPWSGPTVLRRRKEAYKQFQTKLAGTNEVHMIALALDAHIGEGLLTPPALASTEKPRHEQNLSTPAPTVPAGGPRFVLGNWDEAEPHQRAFLANLYTMRVILLHQRDAAYPERVDQWARELWTRGLAHQLVLPVEARGVNAWALAGTTAQWNTLIGQGVQEGWLPWHSEEEQRFPQAA